MARRLCGLVHRRRRLVVLAELPCSVQFGTPSGTPSVPYGPRLFMLPANGVMGDTAFGVNNLYLTSLSRTTIQRVTIDALGVQLPVR